MPSSALQSVAHQIDEGISLPTSAPVAHLDRASGFEPEGSRFKSCRVHHLMKKTNGSKTSVQTRRLNR